jgi:chromosome segregation ATPase
MLEEGIKSLEFRINTTEKGLTDLSASMGTISKDMHLMSSTLVELKEIMKAVSQKDLQFELFRQEFSNHAHVEERMFNEFKEQVKEIDKKIPIIEQSLDKAHLRIETLEISLKEVKADIKKGVWMIVGAFIVSLIALSGLKG